jgi:hypothetical protein
MEVVMLKTRSVGFVAVMMTLFLAACAPPTQLPPSGGSEAGTIDATVAGWNLGAADIVAPDLTGGLRQDVITPQMVLATGTISAAGKLDLTLSPTPPNGQLEPFGQLFGLCDGLTVSDPDTLATFVPILFAQQNGVTVASLINRVDGSEVVELRVYVNKPLQVSGTCSGGVGLTDSYDIDVLTGWNWFYESLDLVNRSLFADGFESGDTTQWEFMPLQ